MRRWELSLSCLELFVKVKPQTLPCGQVVNNAFQRPSLVSPVRYVHSSTVGAKWACDTEGRWSSCTRCPEYGQTPSEPGHTFCNMGQASIRARRREGDGLVIPAKLSDLVLFSNGASPNEQKFPVSVAQSFLPTRLDYIEFLMKQKLITRARRALDNAKALELASW